MLPHWRSYTSHLSIADVPSTIISLAASDSESELEFYSEEDLDAIPQIALNKII
jgi:hypothetical protein